MGAIRPAPGQQGDLRCKWLFGSRPMLRFALFYLLQLAVFNVLFFLVIVHSSFFNAYMNLNARVSGWFLSLIGQEGVRVDGSLMVSEVGGLNIVQGCDGLQPLAIFLAGIVAFPVPWRRKVSGLVIGALFLLVLNIARIISLYFALAFKPEIFETLHLAIWQPVYILLALVCWFIWVTRAMPRGKSESA
jgi:exosortase/archaeosortase family protein